MSGLPLTPSLNRVLDMAADNARQVGDEVVDTSHVLLALFSYRECIAYDVLTRLDVKQDALLDTIHRCRRDA